MPPPPHPVKISYKKEGHWRWPHKFHVSWPPPYSATGSATEMLMAWNETYFRFHIVPSFYFRCDEPPSQSEADETSGEVDASDAERQGVDDRHLRQILTPESKQTSCKISLLHFICKIRKRRFRFSPLKHKSIIAIERTFRKSHL